MYILGGAVTLLLLLFGICVLYIHVNSDEIKGKIIGELNKSIGATISISGEVKLSFLRHFPNVALELQGVQVTCSADSTTQPFVRAGSIYLMANFWDVIRSNWNIKSISIENGKVTMLRSKSGEINYRFDSDTSGDAAVSFTIAIQKAFLKNIRFQLTDELDEVNIHIEVNEAAVQGNFSSAHLALKTTGNVYAQHIQIKKTDYANEKDISFEGSLSVEPQQGSYLLAVPHFNIEQNEFEISGSITMESNNPVFDLTIRGKEIALKDLPQLLPIEYAARLEGIKGTGKVQVSSEIKGKLSEKENPFVSISAASSGAALHLPGMEGRVEGLAFKGAFTNGARHSLASSSITIKEITAKTGQGELHGDFSLTNLVHPLLKVRASGKLDLGLLNGFLPPHNRLKELNGMAELINLRYQGKTADLTDGKLDGLQGSIVLRKVTARMDTMEISIDDARVEAYEKSISITRFDIQLPGNRLSASGTILHAPGLSDEVPSVDVAVKAASIDVEQLLALSHSLSGSEQNAGSKNSFGINGSVRINSGFIRWKKFEAFDASGSLTFNDNIAEIKDFSCNTMDGVLDIECRIVNYENGIATTMRAQGTNINITELFSQLDNFNQHSVTDKNVAGKLDFTADLKAEFVNGELSEKSLVAAADLTISEGQLIDYKPLERLSKFIDIEELRNVRFSTLSNSVSIADRTVTIPEMLVKSNALNLSVSGKQTFDGAMDYHVKVNIFDVLGKKFRKRKGVSTDYEEIGENNFNFYLSMTGTTDKPVIRHEKQTMKERIVQQKNDFHLFRKNQDEADAGQKSVKEKSKTNGKKNQEEEEELEFIEWDEK